MQNAKIYQFPKRGRFLPTPQKALTPDRLAAGQQYIEKMRALIKEGRHE